MKKVLSFLLFTVLFVNIAYAEKKEEKKDILLLEINKIYQMEEYYIKNNELYFPICTWESIEDRRKTFGKSKVYKYEDRKLVDLGLSEKEIDEQYWGQPTTIKKYGYFSNKIIEIDENTQIELVIGESANYENWLNFILIKDGQKKKLPIEYECILFMGGDYLYVDKEYRRIYFRGYNRKKEEYGIHVYDIDKNKFTKITTGGSKPIRVPNTEYLMYLHEYGDQFQCLITEIPEWKAEIEAKDKEKQISDEIKYVIDGPANIREKAKGKQVIGSVEDGIEVTILEKKGDWYKIKKEKIEGWTYKDNIKEIK